MENSMRGNNVEHVITVKVIGKDSFLADIKEMTQALREMNAELEKAGV